MASVAQIIIEVDNQGVTKAFQQINAEAGKLGPTLAPVQRISENTFNNISGGALKARESAALITEEFGVRIPRALRGTLAQAALIGPAMSAAFSALAVIAFAEIAITMIDKVVAYIDSIDPAKSLAARLISFDNVNRLRWHAAIKETEEFTLKTKLVTANESEKIEIDLAEAIRKINEQLESAKATFGVQAAEKLELAILARKQLAAAQHLELAKKTAITVGAAEDAVSVSRARGVAQIEAETNAQVHRIELEKAAGLNAQVAEAQIAEARAKGARKAEDLNREIIDKQHTLAAEGNRAVLQAEASTSSGRERIEKEYLVALNKITQQELQERLALEKQNIIQEEVLDGERTAAKIEYNHKLLELARQRADEEVQIETEAAIAMLPPWQRADAQIVLAAEDRIRKIREMEAKDGTFREQGEREVGAIMQKEWHDRVESMANQLETLYNDISSGGIKKFFITQFRHMIFEMVAAWIVGMNQMRAASQGAMGGGGGGFLSAIFGGGGLGGIFGGGGGGGGQGGISSIPGVITNFGDWGGGGSGGSSSLAAMGISGGGGFTAGGGGGSGESSSLAAMGISAGGGFTAGGVLPSGAGPGGAAANAAGMGGMLAKIFPGGLKIGGVTIPGAMLATGGIALLADAFGKGGLLRGLEGAAGGGLATFAALSPLLAAGPLGWAIVGIGALVGFLVSFFGKSTKNARLAIEANIKQQAKTIEDAYNLFQTDWTGSRTALEALRAQGVTALQQAGVKDISRSRVGHVDQWIDKAEKEIDVTQAERNRRNALTFGPPQFRVGGFVGPGLGGPMPSWFAGTAMHFAGGGAVPAILHEGEYVMRSEAVSRFGRGNLDRMNAGGRGGDTYVTNVNLSAWDGKSVDEWLSAGGMDRIAYAHRRGVTEGRY